MHVRAYPAELSICGSKEADIANDLALRDIGRQCKEVIFAWGGFDVAKDRLKTLTEMFPNGKALVINKDGSPRHPLYVKGDVVPQLFNKK